MSDKVIAIDAMGGDNAPIETVKGAVVASKTVKYNLALVGKEDIINAELSKYPYDKSKIQVVNATEIIENCDTPTEAIKTKKDSSMVVGMNMVKEGNAVAFVSAGNTGALLTGATIIVGRIKGVKRPALGTMLPTEKQRVLMLDSGANVDAKPEYLLQYAHMGSIYMEYVEGRKNPRVGLVNIGTESEKGNALVKEAYQLLDKAEGLNFAGNTEARDITLGNVDVIVCDAFVGNVILKVMEGLANTVLRLLKKALLSSIITKIGAFLSKPAFKRLKRDFFEYDDIGGAPFLGLKGLVVKAHGSSDAGAVAGAIKQCEKFIDADIVNKIAERM
ncbi:MAG: phosphate acyltransferase PlsX [Eubacterium sp.]|nr:phosphate acyltransferase PlsX [Eubacterium sp.]